MYAAVIDYAKKPKLQFGVGDLDVTRMEKEVLQY